ncbi:MAG: trypco2 family protein [Pseudomonadota bacterium]
MRAIKTDLGQYSDYESSVSNDAALPNECKGKINFHVRSVSVTLATKTSVSSNGEASIELPVGGFTLGASGKGTTGRESTQAVTFKLEPKPSQSRLTSAPVPTAGSFYAVLRGLRESLLRSSDVKPCFGFPAIEDQENKIEFGFTVTRDQTMGGKISFLIFTLGAERTKSQSAGNIVVVDFVADPGNAALTAQ